MPRWFLVLELALTGCSFTLSAPAAHRPRNQAPACDAGKGLVVADALIGTGLGLVGIVEAGGHDTTAAILPFALGAAFVGAAIYGNSVTSRCGRELSAYQMEQTTEPTFVPLGEATPAPAMTTPRPVAPSVAPPVAPPVAIAPPAPAPVVAPPRRAPAPPPVDDPWQVFWEVMP